MPWNTSSGTELAIRGRYDDTAAANVMEVYFNSAWVQVASGFTSAKLGFPRSTNSGWWNDTEGIDILPFVDKSSNIYGWNGAISLVASVTTNTIDISGDTIAVQRYKTGSGTLLIDGAEYAYTGSSGNQFTGVTPDPSAAGIAADDVVSQKIDTNASKPASGLTNDIIEILNNYFKVNICFYITLVNVWVIN
mgnify:CR=1 FL=1